MAISIEGDTLRVRQIADNGGDLAIGRYVEDAVRVKPAADEDATIRRAHHVRPIVLAVAGWQPCDGMERTVRRETEQLSGGAEEGHLARGPGGDRDESRQERPPLLPAPCPRVERSHSVEPAWERDLGLEGEPK